jgi:uncharacterized protein YlaI
MWYCKWMLSAFKTEYLAGRIFANKQTNTFSVISLYCRAKTVRVYRCGVCTQRIDTTVPAVKKKQFSFIWIYILTLCKITVFVKWLYCVYRNWPAGFVFNSQKLTVAHNGASHMEQIGYSVVMYSKLLQCCHVQQTVRYVLVWSWF